MSRLVTINKIHKVETNVNSVFNHFFSVVPATTPQTLDEAYRLRYQVYCNENDFESGSKFNSSCETDEYDAHSVHCLLLDNMSRTFVGTVRLILPVPHRPYRSFPIQSLCRNSVSSLCNGLYAAEISRFSISKISRKTSCIKSPEIFMTLPQENRLLPDPLFLSPYLLLGLIRGILKMCAENAVDDLFAVMEPSLLRLLSRFGIYFQPIGPLVNYHGLRQPCHAKVDKLLERVRKERFEAWEIITDEGKLLNRFHGSLQYSG